VGKEGSLLTCGGLHYHSLDRAGDKRKREKGERRDRIPTHTQEMMPIRDARREIYCVE